MPLILIVDDAPLFRESIGEALQRRGYQTTTAADGHEALRRAKEARPDLILLDMSMPRLDGLAALERLHRDPDLLDIPVIMLTDESDKQKVRQAASLGVRGYILKSAFRLGEVLERIEQAIKPPSWIAAPPENEPEVRRPRSERRAAW